MRRLLLLGAMAVCMAGIARAELFENPGFEDGLTGWYDWGSGDGGVGWSSSNAVTVIQDGTAHSGESYAESVWPLSVGTGWGYSMLYQQPWVTPGETYTFSAWVRDGDSELGGTGSIQIEMSFEQRNWDGDTSGGAWRGEEVEERVYVFFDIPSDGEWHQVSYVHTVSSKVNQLGSLITIGSMGIPIDLDDYSLMPASAHNPYPADGGEAPDTLETLSWDTAEPNSPGEAITCVVYFAESFPEDGKYEGDPNFTNYAQQIPEEDVTGTTATIPQALEFGHTYYWRVDCTDSAGTTVVGDVWEFTISNSAPTVEAGDEQHVWLTGGSVLVNLDATVTDDGHPAPSELTYSWSVTGGDAGSVVIAELPDFEDPDTEATITAVGTYTLQLTASDGELSASDTVIINVYENACEATKGALIPLPASDINQDCVVNIADLAELAANLARCMSYDCQ